MYFIVVAASLIIGNEYLTLSIALEILLFNNAFFLSQRLDLFLFYLLLNLLSFHLIFFYFM